MKRINSIEEGIEYANGHGYPVRVLSVYTLRGAGTGTANNVEELSALLRVAILQSPLGYAEMEAVKSV